MASSTVAAQILDDGRTAHSALQIPISVTSDSTCDTEANSKLASKLQYTKLIIWDEIVMTHRHNLEAIGGMLRYLLRSSLPFAGVCFHFIGDFRHILPVVCAVNHSQIVSACFKKPKRDNLFSKLQPQQNTRLSTLRQDTNATVDAPSFPYYLLQVGKGRLQSADKQSVQMPSSTSVCFSLYDMVLRVMLISTFTTSP